MGDILAWLSTTTGIITTVTAFIAAVLLLIEHSKKIVWNPLSRLWKWLFGWCNREQSEAIKNINSSLEDFFKRSEERDESIIGMVNNLSNRINENERDRLRTEMFAYGRSVRQGCYISDEEWRHIQDIYYKYHEVLQGNGQVTEEYNYIKDHYYAQFNKKEG